MKVTIKDLANGEGPTAIMLTKINGKYQVFDTGENVLELSIKVIKLFNEVRRTTEDPQIKQL